MTSEDEGAPGRRRPRRRRWMAAALAIIAGVAGLAVYADLSSSDAGVTQPLVKGDGRAAPGFTLPELRTPHQSLSLSDFRGKDLVVNFWASWCYPCQTEMPLLEAAYRSENGAVQFLGVDTDDSRSPALAFLAQTHVTYPSVFLPDRGAVASSYDLVGLPVTVFVSPSGTLIGTHIGQLNQATLDAALREAFDGRT